MDGLAERRRRRLHGQRGLVGSRQQVRPLRVPQADTDDGATGGHEAGAHIMDLYSRGPFMACITLGQRETNSNNQLILICQ
jgi:hypothetical protein